MDVTRIAEEIDTQLLALPERRAAPVRALCRHYSRQLKSAESGELWQVALRLLDGPEFAWRFVAYELLAHHKAALASLRQRELEQLGANLDRWEAVDTFACYLAGPAWRQRQIADRVVHGWARSPDRWWRRTALVCTVALNNKARGGHGDALRTLGVCRLLIADGDDMVVKAMSWALRELTKRDAPAARAFIDDHRDELAARVLREVGNKLRTGLKNPRGANTPRSPAGRG
jgi:3-methyladenine DNA glycosylase AlkD